MPIEVVEANSRAAMGVFEREAQFDPDELKRLFDMAITADNLDSCRRKPAGELGITPMCHVGGSVQILYAGRMLFVTCAICSGPVTIIKVAS